MKTRLPGGMTSHRTLWAALAALLIAGSAAAADLPPVAARRPMVRPKIGPLVKLPAVFRKADPTTVNDLISMESHVANIVQSITKATVGVRIDRAQGSGVIVSPDGYVLTAGHVSGRAGRKVVIIFPNGTTARGISLGANSGYDSGLIRILDKGPWPYANIGRLKDVKIGDWCVATGHPGGFKPGRTPVVRLGRVIERKTGFIRTDATLVGGDSGGPLFDMHGRVMGINSRIGPLSSFNIHVPISAYDSEWEPLALAEVWDGRRRAQLGINGANDPNGCVIKETPAGLPAVKAGLKVGDVVTRFDGEAVRSLADLGRIVSKRRPGQKVVVSVLRGDKSMRFLVTLDRH